LGEVAARGTAAGLAARKRYVKRVNSRRPCAHVLGRVSCREAGYVWKRPAAQYGLQSFACAVPVAKADVPVQRDQRRPPRKKLPSPQATTTVVGRTDGFTGGHGVNDGSVRAPPASVPAAARVAVARIEPSLDVDHDPALHFDRPLRGA